MSDLTPITREEALLDGKDLEPITRKEQFIKRIYDKTQEVPTPITREEWFLNKAGEGGGGVTIEQLNATENGTYSEQGKAYSPVIVEVPEPTLITKSITANGTYSASDDNADGYSQVTVAVEGFKRKSIANTPTDIASFNDGTANPMPSLEISIVPVQSGSGDPSPSNVRPISGWSGANIYDAGGKNIFDNSTFVKGRLDNGVIGYADNTTSMTITETGVTFTTNSNYRGVVGGLTPVVGGKSYCFDFDSDNASNISTFIDYYDSSSNWISRPTFSNLFIPPSNCSYVRISFQGKTSGTFTVSNIAIYNTTVVSIPFHDNSDNPITVYGGTLNVTSGELRVTLASVDLGTLNWTKSSMNYFVSSLSNALYSNTRINYLCSMYPSVKGTDVASAISRGDKFISITTYHSSNQNLLINDTTYTSVSALVSAIAGQTFVYELATPQTYQLTPTQIATLLGQNNIFADCGQILEGEYFVTL